MSMEDEKFVQLMKGISELHTRMAELEKRMERLEANWSLEIDWHNRLLAQGVTLKNYARRMEAKVLWIYRTLKRVVVENGDD